MYFIVSIKILNVVRAMDIKNLTTFIQVAELGSFSKAGERLGYSQPTVSVQIRQLEEELGAQLFDRIGHAVRLTEQGHRLLPYAQQVVRLCTEMTDSPASQQEKPTIVRLATADSLCTPLVTGPLAQLHLDHTNMLLQVTTAGTAQLFSLLDHNEVDIVCTLDSHIYNNRYVIAAEQKVGVHFVVHVSHPLAQKNRLTRKDLLGQDLLLTEKGMSYRRLLDEWMAQGSMELTPVLEIGSADLLCQLVEQNMGMSFLPDYVTEAAVRQGTVVRLQAEGFHPELWKQLLHHREKWLSPPLQTAIDYLRRAL